MKVISVVEPREFHPRKCFARPSSVNENPHTRIPLKRLSRYKIFDKVLFTSCKEYFLCFSYCIIDLLVPIIRIFLQWSKMILNNVRTITALLPSNENKLNSLYKIWKTFQKNNLQLIILLHILYFIIHYTKYYFIILYN